MSDLMTVIRDYFDEVDPPFEVEELMQPVSPFTAPSESRLLRRPALVMVIAALATLVVVGGITLLVRRSPSAVVDEPTTTIATDPDQARLGLPETVGDTGDRPSIGLGADGLPVVVYFDASALAVELAHCLDEVCTAAEIVTLAEVPSREVSPPLLVTRTDGTTWVAFSETLPEEPWDRATLVWCSTPGCSDPTTTILGPVVVQALAVTADGNPVLAFRSATGDLTLRLCTDPACAGPVADRVVTGEWRAGAVWIGPDGLARVAYVEAGTLVVSACTTPDCTAGMDRQEVLVGIVGDDSAAIGVAVDGTGRPVILAGIRVAGVDGDSAATLVRCLDPDCTDVNVVPLPSITDGASVAVGAAGVPLVVFPTDEGVAVIACEDSDCSTPPESVPLGIRGWWVSIAVGADEIPVIAVSSNTDLAVVRCGDGSCSMGLPQSAPPPAEAWQRTRLLSGDVVATEYPPGLYVGPDGSVAVTFITPEGPVLVTCDSPACDVPSMTPLGAGSAQAATFTTSGIPVMAVGAGPWGGPLELILCDDAVCAVQRRVVLDSNASMWTPPAVALDGAGASVVAFQDLDDYHVYLGRCDTPGCDAPVVTQLDFLVDTGGTRWFANSIGLVVGADDLPLLVISSGRNLGELQLVRCLDTYCDEAEVVVVDSTILRDFDTSGITLAPDGIPVMAWYADGTARFARCTDASCQSWNSVDLGRSIADIIGAQIPSVAFMPDGNPVVAFRLPGSEGVALAVCADPGCDDVAVTPFGSAGSFALAVPDTGLPVLTFYLRSSEVDPAIEGIGQQIEAMAQSVEMAMEEGTLDDTALVGLVEDLRLLASGVSPPVNEMILEVADGIESGGDPLEGLYEGILANLDQELSSRDLWLARCIDANCLAP